MRRQSDEFKNPNDFINIDDIETGGRAKSQYTVESMKKHHDDVVYYKQRKSGDSWFHGRVSNAYRDNYDQIFANNRSSP